jgi:hypothetical protein
VLLLLDRERRSLAGTRRRRWRLGRRYEDLSLRLMLGRLERHWLSEQAPSRLSEGPLAGPGDAARGLAEWARPWGVAPRMKLDAGMARTHLALRRLGRWLPPRAIARAEARARDRFEAIAARMLGPGPHARALTDAAEHGITGARAVPGPSRMRLAAIAALVLVPAGVGAFLLVAHSLGGPAGSTGPRIAGEGKRAQPGALDSKAEASGLPRSPASHDAARRGKRRAGDSGGAAERRATQDALASETVVPPPPPPPAPASQPAPTSTTAPASTPPPAAAAEPPSPAKSTEEAAACPPEFGYEC